MNLCFYKCICNKSFSNSEDLDYHIRFCKKPIINSICNICSKSFSNKDDLDYHIGLCKISMY